MLTYTNVPIGMNSPEESLEAWRLPCPHLSRSTRQTCTSGQFHWTCASSLTLCLSRLCQEGRC